MMYSTNLEPRLQKLVDLGESGTDILHGELKNLMYEAEQQFLEAQQVEEDNDSQTQWNQWSESIGKANVTL